MVREDDKSVGYKSREITTVGKRDSPPTNFSSFQSTCRELVQNTPQFKEELRPNTDQDSREDLGLIDDEKTSYLYPV